MGAEISAFEGLVGKTAEIFGAMVGIEQDDLRQELWIKVVKAQRAYNPTLSKMTEKAFVYACIANFVKDLKRNAARRSGVVVLHIEDFEWSDGEKNEGFELRYMNLSPDEAFALIEEQDFVLPSTVTESEQQVLSLLVLGYEQVEIARTLGMSYYQVMARVKRLRVKFADWRPTPAAPERIAVAA